MSGPERAATWADLKRRPLGERVVAMSQRFLGTPYQVSPLGEGQGEDPDPLFRFDAVDCLTFVEETLALSVAPSLEDVERVALLLRYGAGATYVDRNHLMEAQWLPHNEAKGFLRDVTRRFGGDETIDTVKALTRKSWMSPTGRGLHLPEERQVTGEYPLHVIPLAVVPKAMQEVPSGTVLLVVREDSPSRVTRISHLGFVVHDEDKVLLRHATKGWVNRVVDEELGHFLGRVARHNETDPWRVVGVSLLEPLDPESSKRPASPPP
jgi:hypothetical protein